LQCLVITGMLIFVSGEGALLGKGLVALVAAELTLLLDALLAQFEGSGGSRRHHCWSYRGRDVWSAALLARRIFAQTQRVLVRSLTVLQ